jgi:hypothetical protein
MMTTTVRKVLTAAQVIELSNIAASLSKDYPAPEFLQRLDLQKFHLAEVDEWVADQGVKIKVGLRLTGRLAAKDAFLWLAGKDWDNLPTTDDIRRQMEAE